MTALHRSSTLYGIPLANSEGDAYSAKPAVMAAPPVSRPTEHACPELPNVSRRTPTDRVIPPMVPLAA